MSAYQKKYISQDAGLSYNAFLQHFRNQVKGSSDVKLTSDASLKSKLTTPLCHEGLILVDTGDKEMKNEKGEKIPRLEFVDPNELSRRRALDRLVQQQEDKKIAAATVAKVIKGTKKRKRAHSSSNRQRTRVTKKKSAQKLVNRVKDLFDE